MGYIVKEADPDRDREIMISILERNRTRDDTDYQKRIDWIYLNNPFGRAKAWIIWDGQKNMPVGFTGAFPRPVYVEGQEYLAWNCGDFSIDKKYRTLGVALQLRREAKLAVDGGEVPFLYAHPNKRMELIHFRVGHKKISQMVRYALPLKADRYLSEKISFNIPAKLAALPFNAYLKSRFLLKRSSLFRGEIREKVQCHADHDRIFEKMKKQFKVIGTRSLKYLQWKFADHPNFKYNQFDFYEGNELRGSIFYLIKNNVINLADILIDDYKKYAEQLFLIFIKEVYRKQAGETLSFILQEQNPLIPVMRNLGFKARQDATSSVIAYGNEEKQPELSRLVLNGANWYMTVGDRDA